LVRRSGWGSRLEGAQVHQRWTEIAGEALAQHVQPDRLVGGVLVLRADSSAWAAQIRLLTGELAARADAVLGAGSVRRISVTTGGPGSDSGRRR
jgi:predicted nucleic acid-binding Zn ribbon protein